MNNPNKHKVFKKIKKNYIMLAAMVYIFLWIIIGSLAHVLAFDPTPDANIQYTVLASKPPGTSIQFVKTKKDGKQEFFLNKILFGYFPIYEYTPITSYTIQEDALIVQAYRGENLPTNEMVINKSKWYVEDAESNIKNHTFLLGTDHLGRDIMSRILLGSRVSLLVGFFAVIISLSIGIFIGGIAGYYGGWIDQIVLWKMSVFWSIPTLLLAMALFVALKPYVDQQLGLVFLAIGLTMWVSLSRVVRGQVKQFKQIDFVEAAQTMSYNDFRIIFKHILPNLLGPLLVIMASNFANAILIESGLSFLGLGIQAPSPSWGGLLSEFKDYIGTNLSYLALFPGLLILFLVLSFNLVGNGLRDALDIKN